MASTSGSTSTSLSDASGSSGNGRQNDDGNRKRRRFMPLDDQDFVQMLNSRVGRARVDTRKLKDLELEVEYEIRDIQIVNTRFGPSAVANLFATTENVEFKAFLPSRIASILCSEEAVERFRSRIGGLRILRLSHNGSVDLEFIPKKNRVARSIIISDSEEEDLLSDDDLSLLDNYTQLQLPTTRRELRRKLTKHIIEHRCGVCLDRPKKVVFNCGHQTCEQCSELLDECPICREAIVQKLTLY